MKSLIINSKSLLEPLNIDTILSLCDYDEIEIDITDIKELFYERLSEIFSLRNFLNNIEMLKIASSFKNKQLRIVWKIEIDENDELKKITDIAKKYFIFGLSIKWKDKKLNIDNLEKDLGSKVALFVKNFYQDVINIGVFLRFVEKTN